MYVRIIIYIDDTRTKKVNECAVTSEHRLASIFLPWCSRVIFKIVQERSTYTWPGLARGRTRLPKPNWASTLLGTQPSTTRVSIPARTDWCLSLHRQWVCGRQRAICCLKVRSFRRGTNTRYVLFDILDMSTPGSEFTGSINRIFDPINQCNFVHVHVRTDVIPFQVKWPEKTADPLNLTCDPIKRIPLYTYIIRLCRVLMCGTLS